jgi:hypothetical protein
VALVRRHAGHVLGRTSITTPAPAKEKSGLSTYRPRSSGRRSRSERNRAFGTAGWSMKGSEYLLQGQYQLGGCTR